MSLTESNFADALRTLRQLRGLTQEDFDEVSSRVYVSALERGVKQPTLPKVDALAGRLGVLPLTLLAMSYSPSQTLDAATASLRAAIEELDCLAANDPGST